MSPIKRQDKLKCRYFSNITRVVIYTSPTLTTEDQTVLAEIHEMRRQLASALRVPRR